MLRLRLDWKRAIVFTHRWLGIVLGILFAAWFASGLVMMYARMPRLSPAERLAHRPPLDLSTATVPPADAAARAGADAQQVLVVMALGRPAYRVLTDTRWTTIFADTGERLESVAAADALAEARRYAPDHAATLRYDGCVDEPDQWTFEVRAQLPAHRIALGDAADTYLYVGARTGDVILQTTARERRIAYAGAVLHWLYFTPFRRHGALWTQTIVWLSVAGSVLCLLGLLWGVYVGFTSPYRGWMWWHHMAGLVFGVVTFTWIFSGLLSMDPWDWHPSTAPTRAQREAFGGGRAAASLARLDLAALQRSVAAGARTVEIVPFRGDARVLVDGRPAELVDRDTLVAAAAEAMRGAPIVDATRLDRYDAYYYDRAGELPLPVLRVRFADASGTWLYLDSARGVMLRKEERLTRLNRWLYHGLHSLDFPFLYYRRPLWDIVVVVLSAGGLMSVATAAVPAWRRLRRAAARRA